jgi:hypothetical protein
MPMQEATLSERLAFRFFELVRNRGLSTSWCRSNSGHRVPLSHVNDIMVRRLEMLLASGVVKVPALEDSLQLDLGFKKRKNRQVQCSTVRAMHHRDFPKARPFGEAVSSEEVASITMSFACFMTIEEIGEVRYSDVLNRLRRLTIRQLRAMSYVVTSATERETPNWPSLNPRARGLCSWSCLARVDGASSGAIESTLTQLQRVS